MRSRSSFERCDVTGTAVGNRTEESGLGAEANGLGAEESGLGEIEVGVKVGFDAAMGPGRGVFERSNFGFGLGVGEGLKFTGGLLSGLRLGVGVGVVLMMKAWFRFNVPSGMGELGTLACRRRACYHG